MRYVILIILTCTGYSLVFASSGRLNSSGCHNSQTEGYHCHGAFSYQIPDSGYQTDTQDTLARYATEEQGRQVLKKYSQASNNTYTTQDLAPTNLGFSNPLDAVWENTGGATTSSKTLWDTDTLIILGGVIYLMGVVLVYLVIKLSIVRGRLISTIPPSILAVFWGILLVWDMLFLLFKLKADTSSQP